MGPKGPWRLWRPWAHEAHETMRPWAQALQGPGTRAQQGPDADDIVTNARIPTKHCHSNMCKRDDKIERKIERQIEQKCWKLQ